MISRVAAAVLAALVFCASSRSIAIDAAPRADVLVVGGTPAGVAAALGPLVGRGQGVDGGEQPGDLATAIEDGPAPHFCRVRGEHRAHLEAGHDLPNLVRSGAGVT